jgi:uncharacterized protein (DUF169 family)
MNDIFQQTLDLPLPAVGIAFCDAPPPGLPHAEAEPASCSYWKRAAGGEAFWTDAADHQGCPIGAHTHGVELSAPRREELMGLVGTMVQLGYIRLDEVPSIPQRKAPLRVAVYAPLSKMPCPPDLVLVRGSTAKLMVVIEAAQAAGVAPDAPAMGRPTCAVLPQALDSRRPAMSLGCIGNRVYTGLEEGEGYVAVPGAALEAVSSRLPMVASANAELEKFHRARAAVVATGSRTP